MQPHRTPRARARRRARRCGVACAIALGALAHAVASHAADPKPPAQGTAVPSKPGPDGWYDAKPPDGSFEVRIPGAYQAFLDAGSNDRGVKTRTAGVRAHVPGAFGGNVAYVASCIQPEQESRSAKERLQAGIDQWMELSELQYRKPIEQAGLPGVEFQLKDDVKVLRARLVAPPDGRICTVLLHWRPFAKPSDADIAKYLDSFRTSQR